MRELADTDIALVRGAGFVSTNMDGQDFARLLIHLDSAYLFLVDLAADAMCAATSKCEP